MASCAERTPAITADARQAEALYKSIVARGGFKELEAMRSASSTGGALGNVSNQEGQYLRDAFGALSLTQDPVDLARALKDTATKTRDAAKRVREVYDMTYEYKNQGAPAAAPGAPVRAPGGPVPVPSINSNASAPPAPGGGATGSWSIVR